MNDSAIQTEDLSKRFGDHIALDRLNLSVAAGTVCGLLGPNGAGKTTMIRLLLDLLRPTSGAASVLGLDSRRDSVEIRRRAAYVPEDPNYYPWMRVSELLWFNRGFFPNWDQQLAESLMAELAVPMSRRMRDLSRGMKAKTALILALAQRPEVLLLDDPTSGLDPVVRREFLEATIAHASEEGQAVLFSTHLVHEMERIADRVAILRDGRLLLDEGLAEAKRRHKKFHLVYENDLGPLEAIPVQIIERRDRDAIVATASFDPSISAALRAAGAHEVEVIDQDMEEIYVDLMRANDAQAARQDAGR